MPAKAGIPGGEERGDLHPPGPQPALGRRFCVAGPPGVLDPSRLGRSAVLELRPDCERCGRDLPPESREARICTFECTFCAGCVEGPLGGVCPNCGGNFEPRPIRPAGLLERFPASTIRRGPK